MYRQVPFTVADSSAAVGAAYIHSSVHRTMGFLTFPIRRVGKRFRVDVQYQGAGEGDG